MTFGITPSETRRLSRDAGRGCPDDTGLCGYIGPAIVRAPDEVAARRAANDKFSHAANKQPIGDPVRHPPWDHASLVKAVTIDDERFEAEGPTEVLDPDC